MSLPLFIAYSVPRKHGACEAQMRGSRDFDQKPLPVAVAGRTERIAFWVSLIISTITPGFRENKNSHPRCVNKDSSFRGDTQIREKMRIFKQPKNLSATKSFRGRDKTCIHFQICKIIYGSELVFLQVSEGVHPVCLLCFSHCFKHIKMLLFLREILKNAMKNIFTYVMQCYMSKSNT